MPKRCVVGGCSSVAKQGISIHMFPKDPYFFRLWEKFVSRKRAGWKATPYSCVCSLHFQLDQYVDHVVKTQLGFESGKKKLKPDAVPTIFPRQQQDLNSPDPENLVTARRAFQKREIQRILNDSTAEQINRTEAQTESPSEPSFNDENLYTPLIEYPKTVSTACETDKVKMVTKCITVKPAMRTVKLQTSHKGSNKGIQCVPVMQSTGIQCELLLPPPPAASTPVPSDDEEEMECDDADHEYLPSDTSSTSIGSLEDDEDDSESEDTDYEPANQEEKFVVFRSMLMSLFMVCQLCGKNGAKAASTFIGTLVIVNQTCRSCGGGFKWLSQPYIGSVPAGNLLLSASILFSGAIPSKALKVLRFWGVRCFERHTYFRHQRNILFPAVNTVWSAMQQGLLQSARQNPKLVCGGDARCDSMGHSAKYGSYTLMDVEKNKILTMELVQSNETKGSYHMELEGLKRCLQVLTDAKVKLVTLVTDRHSQIQKWLREKCQSITHYFDIWHVAKGLKKKLQKLQQKKGFELISKWRRSIVNHLYWSAVSSKGDGDVALAKWDSITNHIINVHSGHGELFPTCVHEAQGKKKKYFAPGTECYEQLSDILQSSYLRKDVKKLSPLGQTYGIEGFHSLVNHFAPKMYHFGYSGMNARLLLAVMHYNENSERVQATNRDGELQYSINYPKAKQGGYTVKKVLNDCTYGYVDQLMMEVQTLVDDEDATTVNVVDAPAPLCSNYDRPNKQTAITEHFTRFPRSKTRAV